MMFLRAATRKKDGKEYRYFSVVEKKRVSGGRVLQRHVLYLEEINSSPRNDYEYQQKYLSKYKSRGLESASESPEKPHGK